MSDLERLEGWKWLVLARNEIQSLMLDLHEAWDSLESDKCREYCAAIAFSLWRAAFLIHERNASPRPVDLESDKSWKVCTAIANALGKPELLIEGQSPLPYGNEYEPDKRRIAAAKAFLEKVIERNAIGFAEDDAYRVWTAGYYVNNAVYRTYELWGKSIESVDLAIKPLRRWWNWALHYLRVVVKTGAPRLRDGDEYADLLDDRMPDFVSHSDHRKRRAGDELHAATAALEDLQFVDSLEHLKEAAAHDAEAAGLQKATLELMFPLEDLGWEGELNQARALLNPQKSDPVERDAGEGRYYPTLVGISAGTFTMGTDEERAYEDERPVHDVQLSAFQMSATLITWWQFGMFCLRTHRKIPDDSGFGRGDKPVIDVTWRDAVDYCIWLTDLAEEREGLRLSQVYRKDGKQIIADFKRSGYRLPTEAEWEFAAREGGQSKRFGNGTNIADPKEMNFDAGHELNERTGEWYNSGRSQRRTTRVTMFSPNSLGLYDMSGNVFEWCWDWWGRYTSERVIDPVGPDSGEHRVVRGGSWQSTNRLCRSTYRWRFNPAHHFNTIGFRVVRKQ